MAAKKRAAKKKKAKKKVCRKSAVDGSLADIEDLRKKKTRTYCVRKAIKKAAKKR